MSEQISDVRTCGRQTRSGTPCRNQVSRSEIACKKHATEQEVELAEAHQRGWSEGFHSGYDSAKSVAKDNVARLEQRIRELEESVDHAARVHEIGGDQVVEVGRYAYRWRGDSPLKIGDHVLLPENWLSRMKDGPGPTKGVVTKLGATYRGDLSFIVGRASSG